MIGRNATSHQPTVGDISANDGPGNLAHADFIAAVTDADRDNPTFLTGGDFEKPMSGAHAGRDVAPAHGVATVVMLRRHFGQELLNVRNAASRLFLQRFGSEAGTDSL